MGLTKYRRLGMIRLAELGESRQVGRDTGFAVSLVIGPSSGDVPDIRRSPRSFRSPRLGAPRTSWLSSPGHIVLVQCSGHRRFHGLNTGDYSASEGHVRGVHRKPK